MIKFFRKIRQKLLTEKKFSKYLIYAIGEIVLVVIGILIALQINNWNEDQKNKALEKNMLENLAENLEQNCDMLKSRIRSITLYRKSGAIIISAIENNQMNLDLLENHFHFAFMNTSNIKISDVGYQVIKNKGLDIIRNPSIKKEIIIFFEETQPKCHDNLNWGAVDMADREKFIDQNFIQVPNDKTLTYKPFDIENLFKQNYFVALVYKTDTQRGFFSKVMIEHLKETQRVLAIIKAEINTQ